MPGDRIPAPSAHIQGHFTQPSFRVSGIACRSSIARPANPILEILEEADPSIVDTIRLQPNPVLSIDTGATSNSQGDYAYQLTCTDSDLLYESAEKLVAKLQANPGFVGVSSNMRLNTSTREIEILRDQASSDGVDVADIENTLQLAYA